MVISTQDTADPTLMEKMGNHLREYWWLHLIGTVPLTMTTIWTATFLTLAFIENFG